MTCAFCDDPKVKQRTIAENNSAFVFSTNIPIVPGHVLICPKRHVQYYEDLTDEEKKDIEDLRMKIKSALKKAFGAEGFNYAWNEEVVGGQSVPHFHLHILPRKQGDAGVFQYEPRQFIYRSAGNRPESPQQELDEVVELIKKAL